MKKLLMSLILSSCFSDVPTPEAACGPRPLSPGYSVGFDNDRACMSEPDFLGLNDWRNKMDLWADCIEATYE